MPNKSALYVYINTICIYNVDYIACENSNISCNSANVEFMMIVDGVIVEGCNNSNHNLSISTSITNF